MSTLKFAVISDLHVGLGARSKDLCPVPPTKPLKDRWRYDKKTEVAYREKFVDFAKKEIGSADYLILPGDVTDRAHPEQVRIASDFIQEAAAALHVPHDRIVFVPGNHDVDWSVYDASDKTGVRWGQRYDPIKHPTFCFHGILGRATGSALTFPHFLAWEFPDLFVVGYNSCSHDSPAPEHEVHHGLADPAHMAELRKYLDAFGKPDGRVRLFLVHHHPFDFSNPIPRVPEFSLMTNAEELLKIAHEFGFDILIHGHRHHPRFETHSVVFHTK